MAAWDKIKFLYETMLGSSGSSLTADDTEASGDYDVDYLFNMLETNFWKAADATTPKYITYDAGVGNTKTADYFIINGHNLFDTGANPRFKLEYSSDNFSADNNDAFGLQTPLDNDTVLVEFSSQTARYWRLKITEAGGGLSVAPFIALCIWGQKADLAYASEVHAPDREQDSKIVTTTQEGYVSGIHVKYTRRIMELRFFADAATYIKIEDWRTASGAKNP